MKFLGLMDPHTSGTNRTKNVAYDMFWPHKYFSMLLGTKEMTQLLGDIGIGCFVLIREMSVVHIQAYLQYTYYLLIKKKKKTYMHTFTGCIYGLKLQSLGFSVFTLEYV